MRPVCHRKQWLQGSGRGILCIWRLKATIPGSVAAVASKEQFYEQLSKAMISRLWPECSVNRYVRTLSLCGSDPASIKLQLSRSSSRSLSNTKWLTDTLWNVANLKSVHDVVTLQIPPKDVGKLPTELEEAILAVETMRRPVMLKTEGELETATAVTKRRHVSVTAMAAHMCDEVPKEVVASIIEILKSYAKESISDEAFVKEIVGAAKIHAELLHPMFKYISITLDNKFKKLILRKANRRNTLLQSAADEIKQFTESIPGMIGETKRKLFTRNASSSEWASRTYGTEHCLAVALPIECDQCALMSKDGGQSALDIIKQPARSFEEWFHTERPSHFTREDQKIFLRNLPPNVTIDDIRLAFIGCDPEISDQIMRTRPGFKIKSKKKDHTEDEIMSHNLTLSPVVAVHLVTDNVDDVASKFMYDLPKDHSPVFTDGTTDITSNLGNVLSSQEISSKTPSDPDSDMRADTASFLPSAPSDAAYAFDNSSSVKYNITSKLSSNRVKTALISVSDCWTYLNALLNKKRMCK